MDVLLQHSLSLPFELVMSSEIQFIAVILSIAVIIAAVVIAGYVFIRNNRHETAEVHPAKEETPVLPGEDADLQRKIYTETAIELNPLPSAIEDEIASTSSKEFEPPAPATESEIASAPSKESEPPAPATEGEIASAPSKELDTPPHDAGNETISTPSKEFEQLPPTTADEIAVTPLKELEPPPPTTANEIARIPSRELERLPSRTLIKKTIVPVKISNLIVQPRLANPGELITIRFSAGNFDSSQVQHEVILKVDDNVFQTRILSILPGTIQHSNFRVVITEPGSHVADINGITGVFTITE